MKKFIFVWLLLFFLSNLYSFFPGKSNFSSDYQYSLFRSWIKKNKIRSDGIASFNRNKIKIRYKDKKVIYILKNRKIDVQLEDIFPENKIQNQIYLLSSEVLYRINCQDSFFLYDFVNQNKAEFSYKTYKGDKAIYEFTKNYQNHLYNPDNIIVKNNFAMFINKNDTIKITFPNISIMPEYRLPKSKEKKKIGKKIIKPPSFSLSKTKNIFNFIRKNYNKIFPLEILNNKIKSSDNFIKSDFKDYRIKKRKNIYQLSLPKSTNGFFADIEVSVQNNLNSLKYLPHINYKLKNKNIKYDWGEQIDLSKIDKFEAKLIASSITQLLFEHRALGKKLFNFLLINDAVPSTLVLKKNGKKELFEFQSYSSLLKLLNAYVLGNNVYFSISEVKKVNGYIEIFAYLCTQKKQNNEKIMAEVRFQLDKKFKMKYVMMFLSNSENNI